MVGWRRGRPGRLPGRQPGAPGRGGARGAGRLLRAARRAVAAARRAAPAWAALSPAERSAAVAGAARGRGRAVESEGLAALLTREHGKVLWEAVFDAGDGRGDGRGLRPAGRRGRCPVGCRARTARSTEVAPGAPRRGGRPAAVQLAGGGDGQQGPPGAADRQHRGGQGPAHLPRRRAGHGRGHGRRQLPPGVLNVVNGPGPALGAGAGGPSRRRHGLVHRRGADRSGGDGRRRGRRTQAGGARAGRATTRPSWLPTS